MSEDEEKNIGQATFRDHQAAKKTLGCLESKVGRIKTNVGEILDALVGRRKSDMKGGVFKVSDPPDSFYFKPVDWPSIEDIAGIIEERERVTAKVESLERQIKQQGLGEYLK